MKKSIASMAAMLAIVATLGFATPAMAGEAAFDAAAFAGEAAYAIDNMFLMICAVLVLFMQAGFCPGRSWL